MTMPNGYPSNVAADSARVGVQAGTAYVDTITLPGDVQLTVGLDASPEARYRAGVENLRSGNPGAARTLIWDAMMSGYGTAATSCSTGWWRCSAAGPYSISLRRRLTS